MTTWNVTVEILYQGEPWANKQVKLWYRWPGMLGGLSSIKEYTDSSGHAYYEIEDRSDKLREDTSICFTVSMKGVNYDFGIYELGDGRFTIALDPDDEPEEISPDEL